MRFNFSWNDKEYGQYNSITNGLSNIFFIFLYPLFQKFLNISNCFLSIIGKKNFAFIFFLNNLIKI